MGSYLVFRHRKRSLVLTWEPNKRPSRQHSTAKFQLRLKWRLLLTAEAVESLAVSDDGQGVVVVELVVELVRVGVEVSGLRRFGVVGVVLLRRVLLLAGVVCVAALRTEAAGTQRTDGVL